MTMKLYYCATLQVILQHYSSTTVQRTVSYKQAGALSSCASFVLGVGEEAANAYLLLTVHTCITV